VSDQNEAEIRLEKLRNSLRWALMELGEIGGGGGRTTASDYRKDDGSTTSVHIHEGQLYIEVLDTMDYPATHIVWHLDPEKAAHWLVGALRVVHSHLGGGQ
jgi:hypothetical protein